MRTALTIVISLACAGVSLPGQETSKSTMQTPQSFSRTITKTVKVNYLLFLPRDYASAGAKRWPLILFLHGAGERGSDLQKVAIHGPPKIVEPKSDFQFIVVSPQCPEGETWDNDGLIGLLDEVMAKYRVDPSRVYLTGLSMGGYGTWNLGLAHPDRFAAIAPICGGGETIKVKLATRTKAQAVKSLGIWAFHGAKDPVVSPEESERMVTALQKAGCEDIKLTLYPEASHDSWTETYNNPELYAWFLRHQR
jgi:predicted peptidase